MFIVGTVIASTIAAAAICSKLFAHHRISKTVKGSGAVIATVTALVLMLVGGGAARAAIVPTIDLATAANYSVLAGTTVTNTGPSVLAQSVGVAPGSAITGFPPGLALGIIDAGTATAQEAQDELTAAYVEAANRPVNATTTGELGGLTLVGGVYNGPSNSALTLTGPLVLDGQGDPNSVFIFQTGSSLITASASTVSLINGAQECNVFWQVGSDATLGTGSVFAGNILALTSISVTTGVTVHGRALARNGTVTLDNDVFTAPTCDLTTPTTTTTTTLASSVTPAPGATTVAPGGGTTLAPIPQLPRTGTSNVVIAAVAAAMIGAGIVVVGTARRRPIK
jgi:LPXTG-motif cell wall-anchored protein